MLIRSVWLSLTILTSLSACQSDTGYSALSDECLECLTESNRGCKTEWRACDADPSCSGYAVCQLQAACLEQAPDTGCEKRVGCTKPRAAADSELDAGESQPSPRALASAFEACARSACANACQFIRAD